MIEFTDGTLVAAMAQRFAEATSMVEMEGWAEKLRKQTGMFEHDRTLLRAMYLSKCDWLKNHEPSHFPTL